MSWKKIKQLKDEVQNLVDWASNRNCMCTMVKKARKHDTPVMLKVMLKVSLGAA